MEGEENLSSQNKEEGKTHEIENTKDVTKEPDTLNDHSRSTHSSEENTGDKTDDDENKFSKKKWTPSTYSEQFKLPKLNENNQVTETSFLNPKLLNDQNLEIHNSLVLINNKDELEMFWGLTQSILEKIEAIIISKVTNKKEKLPLVNIDNQEYNEDT